MRPRARRTSSSESADPPVTVTSRSYSSAGRTPTQSKGGEETPAALGLDDTDDPSTRLYRFRSDSVLALAAAGEDERRRHDEQPHQSRSHARSTPRGRIWIYVSVYSGPGPPFGGVSRPPFPV